MVLPDLTCDPLAAMARMKEARMKAYIGKKIIKAEPQEKDGKPGYKVVYPDGYVSWSPKKVFEEAYREISFDEALIVMHLNLSDKDPL